MCFKKKLRRGVLRNSFFFWKNLRRLSWKNMQWSPFLMKEGLHYCCFLMNLAASFRTIISKCTSGKLLLKMYFLQVFFDRKCLRYIYIYIYRAVSSFMEFTESSSRVSLSFLKKPFVGISKISMKNSLGRVLL